MTPAEHAFDLAANFGLPVFPCSPDKKPLTDHGFQDASTDLERIEAWWTKWPAAIVAVPTGKASKLLVVDVDPKGAAWYAQHAAELAPARVHRTSRGHHLLYKMPASDIRNSASKIAPSIDVRAEGGYICWWPAHGLDAVGDLADVAEPPAWLVGAITNTHPTAELREGGKSKLHDATLIASGGRNDYLSREAYRQRKNGATPEQILPVLHALNDTRCNPPLESAEVEAIAQGKRRVQPKAAGNCAFTIADFYAYSVEHRYLCVPTRDLWPASSVDSRLPQIEGLKPSQYLDQCRALDQMTWIPGEPEVIRHRLVSGGGWIQHEGAAVFNLYRPAQVAAGDEVQAGRWIEHVRRVYPNEAEHLIKWLAHRVQRPGEKVNHAIVMGGAQGIGKDTILEPVKHAIGAWNFSEVSPPQMLGRFNGFVKSVILRVSEARDLGAVDRYAFYDHMKAYTAAPPDVLRCDEKNIKEHSVFNVMGVIITSNHKADGIYLPADDRRHFVAWSEATKEQFGASYWNSLWAWYVAGGLGHVAAYLARLDLSGFDPKAPPPKTAAFWDIVDSNRAPEDAELSDAIEAAGNPDAITISTILTHTFSDDFRSWLKDRRSSRQIPHRMESAGFVPVRNDAAKDGLWKINGTRVVVYGKAMLTPAARMGAAAILARGGR